jgi:hypothetical protein
MERRTPLVHFHYFGSIIFSAFAPNLGERNKADIDILRMLAALSIRRDSQRNF